MSEEALLASLRAERDAALEQAAYLEEQLCSLRAYYTHLLDEERRRMFDERTQLATEVASLREEQQQRAYPSEIAMRGEPERPTQASDGNRSETR